MCVATYDGLGRRLGARAGISVTHTLSSPHCSLGLLSSGSAILRHRYAGASVAERQHRVSQMSQPVNDCAISSPMTNLVSHYGPIHTCLPRLDVLDCTEENKPLAACYPHPMIRSEYTEEALPSPYLFQ